MWSYLETLVMWKDSMRRKLLKLLCCPDCRQEKLVLTIYESEGDGENLKIVEGEIRCDACGSRFPVISSIPRMLPISLRRFLVLFHRDFFKRHPDLVPGNGIELPDEKVAQTLKGYSYQHVQLHDQKKEIARWRNNFCDSIPVEPDFFQGKIGADIGCGEGRHLYWAHEFGAEMVGLDLSEGVEIASRNTAECPHCHVVQGDVYHLPFKEGVFDFAYSIGVLHHLPNPQEGFLRVLPSLRPGGKIFIWVYGLQEMRLWYRLSHLTWLRRLGPHLPRWTQYLVSLGLASALELGIWLPCRILSLFSGGDSIINRVPLGDAYRRSFKAKIRSVFDRIQPPVTYYHNAEELVGWFRKAGFINVLALNRDGRGWMATGEKK